MEYFQNRDDFYGPLDPAMEQEERLSPDDVARFLLQAIWSEGSLRHKEAVRLVWNRFGGKYLTPTAENRYAIRRDVLASMRRIGGRRYSFDAWRKKWERRIEDEPVIQFGRGAWKR